MVARSDAAIGSTYNIMPRIFIEMRAAFSASKIHTAMALQAQANQAISLLMRFGVLAAIKAVLTWRGLPVGPPRSPHVPLDGEAQKELRAALDNLGFSLH